MARGRSDLSGAGALSTPAGAPRRRIRPPATEEFFGRFAEAVARNLGTPRYLLVQTALVIVWVSFNVVAVRHLKFDPYPFILLNLAFSTQASYAAPLILLAQNRQEERDRGALERDREAARRTQQDTEYLARELAAIRIALADVATAADIERAVEKALAAQTTERRNRRKGGADLPGAGEEAEPPSPS